jgi:hypothetical protein
MFAAAARGTTWYVAPNGNDARAGTLRAPFATITHAADTAQPGDIIDVRGGVYRQRVAISTSGTRNAPIIFRAHLGETPIIDGSTQPANSALVNITDVAWVHFLGFEVRNSRGIGIVVWASSNLTVGYNDVHDSVGGGIWVGNDQRGTSAHVTIVRNRVHNNVTSNAPHTLKMGWAQAIGILKSDDVAVLHNWIYRNDGEGVAFVLSTHCQARENEVFDNYAVGIYLDNAQTTTVDANFIYSTNAARYFRGGQPAFGIAVANERYDLYLVSDHLTITNNVVARTRSGFYYGDFERGGGLHDTLVAHNTFVGANEPLLRIEEARHGATTIANNIFLQPSGTLAEIAGPGLTFRSNCWSSAQRGSAAGEGDVIGDPHLTTAAGWSAADFHLAAGSPCIDAGTATVVAADFYGKKRAGRPDIGAIEY